MINCEPLSICEKIQTLRDTIFNRMVGQGDVTVVSMGAGQSRVQTEYQPIPLSELRMTLKTLLMNPNSQCCPCYQEACAEAGIPINRFAQSTKFGRCEERCGC